MPNRLFRSLVLFVLLCLVILGVASAQDDTDDPPADSLDQVPAGSTPVPLPTRLPRPMPAQRLNAPNAEVLLYFTSMPQGQTGLIQVLGDTVSGVRLRFENELVNFFAVEGEGYLGLLSMDMEQNPRTYPLDLFISYSDGTRSVLNTEVQVVLGPFIAQSVSIPPEKGSLLDPETERAELARLDSIFSAVTPERLWDADGFTMPILASLTSPFGAFRTFNAVLNTRHTGWDIRSTLGVPIMASAGGRVAYAGTMNIRGNTVFIDHGWGVFSGYAHLSQTHVTRGQEITRGQIIGMTGDTGRTSGPHFHWEVAVNGNWVDSVQFIEMWMP